jgi:isoleucyl-tRNA synthetase
VAHPDHAILKPLKDVIAEEANVKEVVLTDNPSQFGSEVLVVNPRIVGKRVGGAMKDILAASKGGNWRRIDNGAVEVVNHRIEAGEYEVRFQARQGLDATSFDGNAGVVVLDTHVTPLLEREGLARDFIRLVQVARKDAGFNVSDRIVIETKAGPVAAIALEAFADTIQRETLAVSLTQAATPTGTVSEAKLGDEPITLGVKRAG